MKLKGLALLLYAVAATHILNAEIVFAAGSETSSEPQSVKAADPDYEKGKKQIASKSWVDAVNSFTKVTSKDSQNADAYNYLGYAYRNLANYDAAFKAYNKALAINPKHRGANEYIGEAYLQTGNLAKAEQHLAKLDDICTFGCAEYTMLKRAVEKYKANQS